MKILFLLFLLAAISLVVIYNLNKEDIHEQIRLRVSSGLSSASGYTVDIGGVRFVPFNSVTLDRVTVSSPGTDGETLFNANSVNAALDILAVLKEKRLKSTVEIDGMHAGDVFCNATFRTVSKQASTYEGILDPSLLESVFVIDAAVSAQEMNFRKVFGTVEMRDKAITGCKLHFKHNDTDYLLEAAEREGQKGLYGIAVRSKDLGFGCTIGEDNGDLVINDLSGMFHNLHFDLKGGINAFKGPDAVCSLNGTVETDTGSFSSLPGKAGEAARTLHLSGPLRANLFLSVPLANMDAYELSATVSGNGLRVKGLRLTEISARASVSDNRLTIPLMNGLVYGGTFSGDLKMDLKEKNFPYMFTGVMNNMDFERFMIDFNGNTEGVYGTLNADLSLKGYAPHTESYEGNGSVTISNGDLGPMPILTPLLGDLYGTLQKMVPGMEEVTITEAYVDFEVASRRIMTDDLTFIGKDISITAEGYLDFDGNLDFVFMNELRSPAPEEDENWQLALRNAIVNAGKFIKKTRLRGTISEPEWGI